MIISFFIYTQYNFYTKDLVEDICSGKYDCNSRPVPSKSFTSRDAVRSRVFCSKVGRELNRADGCIQSINRLRQFGSVNSEVCSSGRCSQLAFTTLTVCGFHTVSCIPCKMHA